MSENTHSVPGSDGHDAAAMLRQLPRVSGWGVGLIIVSVVILFTAAFLLGWIPHVRKLEAARAAANNVAESRPVVEVIAPRPPSGGEELVLPADVRANQSTELFARLNGYLKALPAGSEIGSRVKAGQVLAELDAPEIDAQWDQAQATLEQTRATVERLTQEHALAVTTLNRYEAASNGEAVAAQEMDETRIKVKTAAAALKESQTSVTVAEASLKRLSELRKFEKIVAPFDGVITYRGFDVGALVAPGEAGSGRELFRIQDTGTLRVSVSVPQSYAMTLTVGTPATLTVRSLSEKGFVGAVARTAGAIDPATRTLRVEVDVPNGGGEILPGMYGQIRLKAQRQQAGLVIPAASLLMGAEGVRVVVVDGSKAHMRSITLGRDFGTEVEVLTGLSAGDSVINNPSGLTEGVEVSVRKRVARE